MRRSVDSQDSDFDFLVKRNAKLQADLLGIEEKKLLQFLTESESG